MNDDLEVMDRIVVKVGTSGITKDGKVDLQVLTHLAEDIAELRSRGKKIIIVTSGARVLGEQEGGIKDPRTAAGVGQVSLMNEYKFAFKEHGIVVEQLLVESRHFRQWLPFFRGREIKNVKRAVDKAWEEGVVPIVNENDPIARERTTLGDNDKVARRLAKAVKAQMVIFLSTMHSENGRGGADSKLKEIKRLERKNILVRLEDAKKSHPVMGIFNGDPAGELNVKALHEAVRGETRLGKIRMKA